MAAHNDPSASTGRCRGAAILALVALLVLTVYPLFAGGLLSNSDSLLPVFASLYHWTPYYWDQNRYGMLIPLLCLPIDDPALNLAVQTALRNLSLLAAPFLIALLVCPSRHAALIAGTAGIALLVACSRHLALSFIAYQPYGQSLSLGCAGLWLSRQSRAAWRCAGACGLATTLWVDLSAVTWLVPLAVATRLAAGRTRPGSALRSSVGDVGLIVVAALALAWLARRIPVTHTVPLDPTPHDRLFPTWWSLLQGWLLGGPWFPVVAGGAAIVASWWFVRSRRARVDEDWSLLISAWTPLLVAGVQLVAAGCIGWVATNQVGTRGWRYAAPSLVFLLMAPACVIGSLSIRLRLGRSMLGHVLAWLCVGAILFDVYGVPRYRRAIHSLRFNKQRLALDPIALAALRLGATHVLGNYWHAIPIAFRANTLAHHLGRRQVVWPVTARLETARSVWQPADWRTARILTLRDDPWVDSVRLDHCVPELEVLFEDQGIRIARGKEAVGPGGCAGPRAEGPSVHLNP